MPTIVRLTPAELAFCVNLASQRFSCKPEVDRFKAHSVSAFGSHLAGVMAELCASKVYGCKIDQGIYLSGDKHKPDLTTRAMVKIEVKATTYSGENPMLKIDDSELLDGINYVLARIVWPDTCSIYAPVSCDFIKKNAVIKNFGYGNRFTVTAEQIATATEYKRKELISETTP